MTFSKFNDRLEIAQRFLTLAYDTVVFLLTVAKTLKSILENRRLGIPGGLRYALLRDGTIFYFPILILTLLQTLPIIINVDSLADEIISPFGYSIQNLLVNRLVLSLRQTARRSSFMDDSVLAQSNLDIPQDEILLRLPCLKIAGASGAA